METIAQSTCTCRILVEVKHGLDVHAIGAEVELPVFDAGELEALGVVEVLAQTAAVGGSTGEQNSPSGDDLPKPSEATGGEPLESPDAGSELPAAGAVTGKADVSRAKPRQAKKRSKKR